MEFWEDYEVLHVETPEGLDLRLPLAGFGPRFLAFLVDMAIVSAVQAVIAISFIFIVFGGGLFGGSDAAFIVIAVVMLLVLLLLPLLYFMYFEARWEGQSPGKRLAGIRVLRRGGFPLGAREIALRNVLRILDLLPANWMVGVISFFATRNQQRVGDLVADTIVVREFRQTRPFAWTAGGSGAVAAPTAGLLTPALSYVITSYLQRAGQLGVEAREELSRECIRALGYDPAGYDLAQREGYLLSVVQQAWAGRA